MMGDGDDLARHPNGDDTFRRHCSQHSRGEECVPSPFPFLTHEAGHMATDNDDQLLSFVVIL
jgi:hypothetical protein